jgi:tripartite-type tricarboxylate transporter receptor subunit TctC
MKLPRRQFVHLAARAAALPALPRIAWAQAYPSRPVRIVIGFPAGGGADVVARLLGQWLSERLGQPFVIENRPGAASNIGTETVVRAPPDGYTLLMVILPPNAINATLYDKLNFNFIRDIAPIAGLTSDPLVNVGEFLRPSQRTLMCRCSSGWFLLQEVIVAGCTSCVVCSETTIAFARSRASCVP